ncbi:hypothetical protein BDP27DRAFT_1269800 [Rhodocollybia butyracea]|uniref:WW domain-containing protein n=1 Tax=Rhodocollybia butyracea TaxID=206335 RepID=A0A9P5PMY2_9AGAR|nr:hypothetical protein BDP27DRAFT_1269800 [Rhodocollybia butyracea]
MNLLRWILKIFQKLRVRGAALATRLIIQCIHALRSFLFRRRGKDTKNTDATHNHPDIDQSPNSAQKPASMSSSQTATRVISASRFPDTDSLPPYPLNNHLNPSASASSYELELGTRALYRHSSADLPRTSQSKLSGHFRHHSTQSTSHTHLQLPTAFGYNDNFGRSQHSICSTSDSHGSDMDPAPMQAFAAQTEHLETVPENQVLEPISSVHDRFCPIAPSAHSRYIRNAYVDKDFLIPLIPALTRSFQTEAIPEGWKKLIHPEGACYYVFEDKRYWTDANIMDEWIKNCVTSCIHDFDAFIRSHNVPLSSDTNIVFNLDSNDKIKNGDENKYTCGYYIVEHSTRSVFWLDTFKPDWFPAWFRIPGVKSLGHIQHEIVSQYWYHCNLYPHSFSLTLEHVEKLHDILLYSISDTMISDASTVPYSLTHLKDMMLLVNNIRDNLYAIGGVTAYSRLMHIFEKYRFLNFASTPFARLERYHSVYHPPDDVETYPWLMKVFSPVLFSAPYWYFRSLTNICVDGLVHEAAWSEFINRMNEEWQQLTLFNTVLVNANVGFLAIQSIDNASNLPGRSPAQIASFLSVIASAGSIVLGLIHVRKHRGNPRDTAAAVARYINSWTKDRLGLATLAVLYSVPYALLMWGVICFLLAFSFMCYSPSSALVRALMSSAWFVVTILVLWYFTTLATWAQRLGRDISFWSISMGHRI